MKRLLAIILLIGIVVGVKAQQQPGRGYRSIYHVFASDYGPRNSATLQAVLNRVGTSRWVTVVIDGGVWNITNSIVIPPNVELVFARGSRFLVASNATVTVNTVYDNSVWGAEIVAVSNLYSRSLWLGRPGSATNVWDVFYPRSNPSNYVDVGTLQMSIQLLGLTNINVQNVTAQRINVGSNEWGEGTTRLQAIGLFNTAQVVNTGFVLGRNNTLTGSLLFVCGESNTVRGHGNVVYGRDITLGSSVTNNFLFGKRISSDESDAFCVNFSTNQVFGSRGTIGLYSDSGVDIQPTLKGCHVVVTGSLAVGRNNLLQSGPPPLSWQFFAGESNNVWQQGVAIGRYNRGGVQYAILIGCSNYVSGTIDSVVIGRNNMVNAGGLVVGYWNTVGHGVYNSQVFGVDNLVKPDTFDSTVFGRNNVIQYVNRCVFLGSGFQCDTNSYLYDTTVLSSHKDMLITATQGTIRVAGNMIVQNGYVYGIDSNNYIRFDTDNTQIVFCVNGVIWTNKP